MIAKKVIYYVTHYHQIKSAKTIQKRFLDYCDAHSKYRDKHRDVYEYVKAHGVTMYPYPWFSELKDQVYEVRRDGGVKYTIYKGKKLYYPLNVKDSAINGAINFYEKEQDPRSPHCYIPTEDKNLREGDVLVECGASEGTFALSHIDKCSKIYLFEGDPHYAAGLKLTFAPYGDKVVVIDKFVDSYSHGDYTMIDDVVKEPVNFIKMDIEGFELKALFGAKRTIKRSNNLRMSICAYHNSEDYAVIPAYLKSLGCETSLSKGCLFRTDDSIWDAKTPDLRHGMIFGKKERKKEDEEFS